MLSYTKLSHAIPDGIQENQFLLLAHRLEVSRNIKYWLGWDYLERLIETLTPHGAPFEFNIGAVCDGGGMCRYHVNKREKILYLVR